MNVAYHTSVPEFGYRAHSQVAEMVCKFADLKACWFPPVSCTLSQVARRPDLHSSCSTATTSISALKKALESVVRPADRAPRPEHQDPPERVGAMGFEGKVSQ
eukprot:1126176-Rhodomonas_salina.1